MAEPALMPAAYLLNGFALGSGSLPGTVAQVALPAAHLDPAHLEAESPVSCAVPSDPTPDAATSRYGLYQTRRLCSVCAVPSASPAAMPGRWCCPCSRSAAPRPPCGAG